MKFKIYINWIAALFIFLFTYTAISKVLALDLFRNTLGRSPVIGSYADIFAIGLPVTEFVIAGFLFFPKLKLAGLYSSFFLMSLFTLYLGYMILFNKDLPCSCGGVLQQMNWQQHLWFNLFFTFLAGIGIYLHRRKPVDADSSFA